MMMMLRREVGTNRLARRLIILIITFSSILALFATAAQLFFEYREHRADMDATLDQVGIFMPPLAAAVWSFDDKQIELSLNALVHLPHMERATVAAEGGGAAWSAGTVAAVRQVVRVFPIEHMVRGEVRRIATLEVTGNLDWILQRMLSRVAAILISNGIKTFLVAAFIFVVVRRLVTSRVEDLAGRVAAIVPREAPDEVATPAEPCMPSRPRDEIEELSWSFDDMKDRLYLAIQDFRASNESLRQEIGERQRVQAELQRMVAELSQTNALLDRFAHATAHDLREPARNLVSFSQLLERRQGDRIDAEGREYLGFIIFEAKRMAELVAGLLDYSRCDRQSLRVATVDCTSLVEDVIRGLRPQMERQLAKITVAPLPCLVADERQLRQVFENLIDNALKFGATDRPPDIRVVAEREGDAWRFDVSDSGVGIDPQYHSYVFELFRRLHTHAAIPGAGVGLALCRRVVENHGGRIWLDSRPDGRTHVVFTIPDAPSVQMS